eukprot:01322_4
MPTCCGTLELLVKDDRVLMLSNLVDCVLPALSPVVLLLILTCLATSQALTRTFLALLRKPGHFCGGRNLLSNSSPGLSVVSRVARLMPSATTIRHPKFQSRPSPISLQQWFKNYGRLLLLS